MPDIFISYSRKDSEQALQLADRLRSEGLSVWIDQHGIGAATSWSREIVTAIDDCRAFVVLLSDNSIQSANVIREVSIASESSKRILPIAIQDIKLNNDLRYHLAGIQRVAYTEFSAITEALHSFGIVGEKKVEKKQDDRKSLLVMPFDDLSPTQDNLWFADGLAGELVDRLSHIKSLRMIDRKTSRDLRNSKLSTFEIASTLEVQYIIEGSVRKFDDQIKISISLLNVFDGEYLWQQSHKGVMQDIFVLQESVADKVVEALKLHLGSDEINAIGKFSTEDAEAYELWMKGREQYHKFSHTSLVHAIDLYREALQLDPECTSAMSDVANAACTLYQSYDRSPEHLELAQQMIARIKEIEGESARWCWLTSTLSLAKSEMDKVEDYARRAVNMDQSTGSAHDALAFALRAKGDLRGAAEAWKQSADLRQSIVIRFSYLVALHALDDPEELRYASLAALPEFERHLKLNPDDFHGASQFVVILWFAGERQHAHELSLKLLEHPTPNGFGLFNIACVLAQLGETTHSLSALRKSIEHGFADTNTIQHSPELTPLHDIPEYQELMRELLNTKSHVEA